VSVRLALLLCALSVAGAAGAAPAGAATFTVVNTNDSGPGSLRMAILAANANPTRDRIVFAVRGPGPYTIPLVTPLATIAAPVEIGARTQRGYAGTPLVQLDDAGGRGAVGLDVTAGSSTVEGLSITGFGTGIRLETGSGNTIAGNWIGLDTGGAARGNGTGVEIRGGSSANLIGGTRAAARNVVSGNTADGIVLRGAGTAGNRIEGDFVGTSTDGTHAVPNLGDGIVLHDGVAATTIGGTSAGARNVSSGNGLSGVCICGTASATLVEGDYVGTDATGLAALDNRADGVYVGAGATGTTIGGTSAGARNVISGNADWGVEIYGRGTTGTVVDGNYVGVGRTGAPSSGLGNELDGVGIRGGASGNVVGGTAPGAGNLVSGNDRDGVLLSDAGTSGNAVEGNTIGTAADGTPAPNGVAGVGVALGAARNTIGGTTRAALNAIGSNPVGVAIDGAGTTANAVEGNDVSGGGNGVAITGGASANVVGGSAAGAGNVVYGNSDDGVHLADAGTSGNLVQGNLIGGGTGRENGTGVRVFEAGGNTIGGTSAAARNVISGNRLEGVVVAGTDAVGNVVEGNFVGTDATGAAPFGNGRSGISIVAGASGTVVGGTSGKARNVVSANGTGITVGSSTGTLVEGNAIGTDAGGTIALPNFVGILLDGATRATIGGTSAAARNLVSGNSEDGVSIQGSDTTGDVVEGNWIGLDGRGRALGNGVGLGLGAGAHGDVVARNTISGNEADGIQLSGAGTTGNVVRGNGIGTDPDGPAARGNGGNGATFFDGAGGDRLGGTSADEANVVAFNRGDGVVVDGGSAPTNGELVERNSIFANGGLGIRLASGGNDDQPAPAIASVTTRGAHTRIVVAVDGRPATNYRVEVFAIAVCDVSGAGEGQRFLAAGSLTTDGFGFGTAGAGVPVQPAGEAITSTAVNTTNGDTSAFSRCFTTP